MSRRSIFKWILILVLIAAAAFAVWYFFRKSEPNPVSGLKPRVEMSIAHIGEITDSTIKMRAQNACPQPASDRNAFESD